jgi:hypothetical protein
MSYYLYIQSGEVRLIPEEKMPVKPEFKGDYFLHYGPQKQYEESLEIAKRDSILCADQEKAKQMVFKLVCERSEPWPHQLIELKEGEIYGPFEGNYKIENGYLSCSNKNQCHCNEQVAILSDPYLNTQFYEMEKSESYKKAYHNRSIVDDSGPVKKKEEQELWAEVAQIALRHTLAISNRPGIDTIAFEDECKEKFNITQK